MITAMICSYVAGFFITTSYHSIHCGSSDGASIDNYNFDDDLFPPIGWGVIWPLFIITRVCYNHGVNKTIRKIEKNKKNEQLLKELQPHMVEIEQLLEKHR